MPKISIAIRITTNGTITIVTGLQNGKVISDKFAVKLDRASVSYWTSNADDVVTKPVRGSLPPALALSLIASFVDFYPDLPIVLSVQGKYKINPPLGAYFAHNILADLFNNIDEPMPKALALLAYSPRGN